MRYLSLLLLFVYNSACATVDNSESRVTSASQKTVTEIVQTLASDQFAGRESMTAGGKAARDWLKTWLKNHDTIPAGTADSYEQPFDQGVNLIAIVAPKPVRHPEAVKAKSLKPRVILSAHYDHWGQTCRHRKEARSPICDGAADNAGGVAVVLAAAESLAAQLSAPVAITLWDGEEKGLLGSKYFVSTPSFDLSEVKLMINMDIVGINLFRGLENHHFIIGAETGGANLQADANNVLAKLPLKAHSLSYALGDKRSDMTSFVRAGLKIPTIFFSDGDGSVYHSDADETQVANLTKVKSVADAVVGLTLEATKADRSYVYSMPRIIGDNALPLFSDVQIMEGLVADILKVAANNRLNQEQLTGYATQLADVRKAGAAAFDPKAMQKLAEITAQILKLSKDLPFIP